MKKVFTQTEGGFGELALMDEWKSEWKASLIANWETHLAVFDKITFRALIED